MSKKIVTLLAVGATLGVPATADAALVFNIKQIGSSIIADGNGSINTYGLNSINDGGSAVVISAEKGGVFVGEEKSTRTYVATLMNPENFGTGDIYKHSSNGTGDTFGLYGWWGRLYLPHGYVSGSALSGTATFANASFASLGLTQGSYLFNMKNGDTITVNVGAVPEPATWALMTLGMGAVGLAMRRRRKVTTTIRLA